MIISVDNALEKLVDNLDGRLRNVNESIDLGIKPLDEINGGLIKRGELTLVSGVHKAGVSNLLINLSYGMSVDKNSNVLFISFDHSKDYVLERKLSMLSLIPLSTLETGKFQPDDWPKFNKGINILSTSNFSITDELLIKFDSSFDAINQQVVESLMELIDKVDNNLWDEGKRLDAIFIDYLQLLMTRKERGNNNYGEILARLKKYAKARNTAVILGVNLPLDYRGLETLSKDDYAALGVNTMYADTLINLKGCNKEEKDSFSLQVSVTKKNVIKPISLTLKVCKQTLRVA